MTLPAQEKTVIAKPFTGDYRIDVLLDDISFRWNAAAKVGTPTTITYSFLSASPSFASDTDKTGFKVFTDAEKVATRKIFAELSQYINVTFTEVDEAARGPQGILFANNTQTKGAGYASLPTPNATNDGFTLSSGNVYLNYEIYKDSTVLKGSYDYSTLVHEIGHAIGLNHPGNYNAGEPASTEAGNYLAADEDRPWNTIMSYRTIDQAQERDFFGTYDMLALKFLYGAKAFNTGNDTYKFGDSDGSNLSIINDTGGNDTLDLSAVTIGARVDLNPGAHSSVGIIRGEAAINTVSIAFDATIENAIGTALNDNILGNSVANLIRGGGGNDDIDGGAGVDTAAYVGNRSNFKIVKTAAGFGVYDDSNVEGADTLKNVETLKFANMSINLGVGDKAKSISAEGLKSIVELYIAYFNRVPDGDGMSYWIDQFKAGTSIDQIGKQFYAAAVSPSFTALTGYSDSMSNGDFLKVIYKSVLGRDTVDQGGFDYWTGALAKPEGTAGAETRGSLIKTILGAAHAYKGKPDLGYVADLLDNKFAVGKYFAIEQGISYNTPDETYAKSVAIAAKVTPTDTSAAITLIGVTDVGFTLV